MSIKDMDVVYMVKDAIYNEELKYSLRSVDYNLPHRYVWFVGGKPMYLHPDKQVIINQKGNTKWDKVRAMLKTVAENDNISEDFILFNDDFFVMRAIGTLPTFSYGTLSELCWRIERKNKNRPTKYTLEIERTIKALESNGFPTDNYELHIPMVMNRKKLLEIIKKYPDTRATRSLYGNTYLANDHGYMMDVKIFDSKTMPKADSIFLSTEDSSFAKGEVGRYIRQQFPNKSKWER